MNRHISAGVLGAFFLTVAPGPAEARDDSQIWTTASEIGRNRVLAVSASLGAVLVAVWMLLRGLRDRSIRRRSLIVREG